MSLEILCIRLSQASSLLPIIRGVRNYRRLTMPFKLLLYFFVISIGFEVLSVVLARVFHNNMPGLHLFTIVELLTFSSIFYIFFRRKRKLALFILINTAVFLLAAAADICHRGIWSYNAIARSYSSISILSYTLIYFYFMFGADERSYTIEHPMFWVSIGTIVYFGSNALYFMFNDDLMTKGPAASKMGGVVHLGLNIIANYLYAQSFRCFNSKTA